MARDTVGHTILVAGVLCVVCSVIVSGLAVGLRAQQVENRQAEKQKNILLAAGTYDENKPVNEQFGNIESKLVDLETGTFVEDGSIDPETYDQRKAAADPALSIEIDGDDDKAGIKRREKYAFIYVVKDDAGEIDQFVLPIYGKGLWSTLYGFIAVDDDIQTVNGLTFYEHKETPGLGGEVDNPKWKALWPGKQLFDTSGSLAIEVIKGQVTANTSNPQHKVDGLTGATITARGVGNTLQYWLGDNGFGPFLENFRTGALQNG